MREIRYRLAAALIGLSIAGAAGIPQAACAGGVPTFDGATFAQAVATVKELGKQLREAEKQTGKLQDIIADLTGPRGISGLLNDATQKRLRRYADTTLASFTELAAGAGSLSASAGDLETEAQRIVAAFGLRPGADMIPSAPEGPRARSIDLAQGTTLAAMTVGERAFDDAPSRLAAIEGLVGEIDRTPDLKASVDLNTRMQAQVALLLNEMLMVQGLQLRSQGVNMNLDAIAEERTVATFSFDPDRYNAINAKPED